MYRSSIEPRGRGLGRLHTLICVLLHAWFLYPVSGMSKGWRQRGP